jgi:hypothetical protein
MFENLDINHFANKDKLGDFSFCVLICIAGTQLLKLLFPQIEPRLFVVSFSIWLCAYQAIMDKSDKYWFSKLTIMFVNTILTSISAIGLYEIGVKFLFQKINGGF